MAKSKSQITEVLMEFGLSDVEAQVYQAALAVGSRPASVIAQKTGLKRGHTYNVLSTLMEKGIVQEFVKGGIKHFTCSPPSSLVAMANAHEEQLRTVREKLEQILPELEGIRSPLSAQPKVRFYPGYEGIREIYDDMLRVPNQDILCFIDMDYSWSAYSPEGLDFMRGFIQRREERQICWKGLVVRNAAADNATNLRPSKLRQIRMIDGIRFPAQIHIYGFKVALISSKEEFVGVVVENEPVAQTLRQLFEHCWNNASEPNEPERKETAAKGNTKGKAAE